MELHLCETSFDRKRARYLTQPAFTKLLTFLAENQEKDIFLREIRQLADMDYKQVDAFIDFFIKMGVIQRDKRLYKLTSPVISAQAFYDLLSVVRASVGEFLEMCSDEVLGLTAWTGDLEKKYVLLAYYVFHCLPDKVIGSPAADYLAFYEQTEGLFASASVKQLSSGKYTVVSFQDSGRLFEKNMPSYFNCVQLGDCHGTCFELIYELIGDVNPHFYLPYVAKKIRRMAKTGKMNRRDQDIFIDSLEAFEVIGKDAAGQGRLQLPVFDKAQLACEFPPDLLDRLGRQVRLLDERLTVPYLPMWEIFRLFGAVMIEFYVEQGAVQRPAVTGMLLVDQAKS